jgi:hypothetical protein
MVFFAPLMAFSSFFIRPIFREYSQENHEERKACHANHEIGEIFKAVFDCLVQKALSE